MDDVTKESLLSVARIILGAAGGALITHGYLNEAEWTQVAGILTALAPVIWGIINKQNSEKKTQIRVAEAYNAGSSQMPPPKGDQGGNQG
jgi:hypothetical protein